ncbi:MAG: TIGR00266 family protein [Halosimplex sp.]
MEYELENRPAYAVASVRLSPGEELTAEAGAMVSHTETIRMETGIGDADEGFLESVKDSVLGEESLFRNRFTAEGGEGVVQIAATTPGDMTVRELDGGDVYVQSGAYEAAGSGVELDTDVGGLDTLFGGEGLFLLRASGTGPLFLSSFGGIQERTVEAGEVFTVDSGHVVAWDAAMEYNTERIGGMKETLFSDEGLVMRFTGPGTVLLQTRNYGAFVSDLASRLPSNNSGGGGGVETGGDI